MIFDLFIPPKDPWKGGKTNTVVCPIHVSNSHTKYCWISSNGLGGDSIMDRRTAGRIDRRTDRGDYNIQE